MIRARHLPGVSAAWAGMTVWLALLGLVTTPVILHGLGQGAYGMFAVITIMSAYLLNLEFGFGFATVRFLARANAEHDEEAKRRVLSTSFAVFATGGAVAFAIALGGSQFILDHFAHFNHKAEALLAIRLGAIALLFSFLSSLWSSTLQALGHFRALIAVRTALGTISSAAAILVIALGGGLTDIVGVQAGLTAIGSIVLGFYAMRAAGGRIRPRIHVPTLKAMAAFGVLVLATGITYQLMLQGPPTVLAHSGNTAQVALYAVPSLVLQQLVLLVTAASVGFMPFASAASANPSRAHLGNVFRSNLRVTTLAMGPIAAFLIVFAHPLLAAWIGSSFAHGADQPLRVLAAAAYVLAMSAPPADVARGLDKPGWVLWFTVAAAALSVGISLALVLERGATGVAFGLLAGLTAATVPFIFEVGRRLLGVERSKLAMALLRPLAAVLGVALLYRLGLLAASNLLGAVLSGLAFTPLYVAAAYRYVLDDRERTALRSSMSWLTGSNQPTEPADDPAPGEG